MNIIKPLFMNEKSAAITTVIEWRYFEQNCNCLKLSLQLLLLTKLSVFYGLKGLFLCFLNFIPFL